MQYDGRTLSEGDCAFGSLGEGYEDERLKGGCAITQITILLHSNRGAL
jgi:hypothetical protein